MSTPSHLRPVRRRRRLPSRIMRRRLARIGCIPAAVLSGGVIAAFAGVYVFSQPSWIYSGDRYLTFMAFITLLLGLLVYFQFFASWIVALLGAGAGAQTVARFASLGERMRIVRNRWLVAPIALLLVRLTLIALVVGLGIALVYVFTASQLSIPVSTQLTWLEQHLQSVGIVAGLWLIPFLAGPFLRFRYNLALGAFVATFVPQRRERAWTAVITRQVLGIALMLVPFWLLTIVVLSWEAACDMRSVSQCPALERFTTLPAALSDFIELAPYWLMLLLVSMAWQVIMPGIFMRMAETRLARPDRSEARPETFARILNRDLRG